MIKIKLGLRRRFNLKKNLSPRLRKEVVPRMSSLLVPNVARTILVSVYWVPTGSLYCGKEGQKVRDCPMIASRGREGKQVAPSVPKDDASTKRRFYAIRSKVEKPDEKESDNDVGKFSFFC